MARDEDFLRRWSRRKHAAAKPAAAPQPAPEAPPPAELPSLDSLDFESDFKAFMHSKVEDSLKRAALKKLFKDPRFNVMDGLDVYIDDYSNMETLSPEMVATLEHAKSTLLGPKKAEEEKEKMEKEKPAEPPEEQSVAKKDDGDPRQDA